MCGITGFVDFRRVSGPTDLEAMTATLSHRGPDDSGCEVVELPACRVGLGQRRLSIIDLSAAGHQPMWTPDRKAAIVFNGEVYNHAELRPLLARRGLTFQSTSDTEVALQALQAHGTPALRSFIGMFALGWLDVEAQTLTLVRDRAGVKPLYFSELDGLFLFGSELKALVAHPRFSREIRPEVVPTYLQLGWIPAPDTIYRNTWKLEPGHVLVLDLKTGRMERERYWDPTEAFGRRFSSIREEEAIRECDRLLVSAARYRMVADVPVGLFLSGGYDSTAVAAVLQQGMGEPLRTYTIGFHELEYDEAPFARKVAAWLGTRHCELYCTQKDALEMVWRLPEMFDEPFGDVSGLPTLLVSRLARQEVKVAMSADAGDETFGGYARYRDALRLHRMMQAVPGAARRAAARVLCAVPDGLVPGLLGRRNGFGRREKGAMLLAGSGPRRVLEEQLSVYSSREAARLVPGAKGVRDLFGEPGWPRGLTPLRQMQLADFRWYLPDDILAKVDRTSMAVSLEAREPLLDHRLLEFAAALPDRFKVRGGTLKWLLRQVVHRRVPRGLVERPKRGFGVPIGSWLKGELRPLMEECLEERRLRAQGLFDPARVAVEKRRFLEGGQADASRIWFLVAFQMWHGRWIGR